MVVDRKRASVCVGVGERGALLVSVSLRKDSQTPQPFPPRVPSPPRPRLFPARIDRDTRTRSGVGGVGATGEGILAPYPEAARRGLLGQRDVGRPESRGDDKRGAAVDAPRKDAHPSVVRLYPSG